MATTKGTILVTGASGGLGGAIVKQIISQPELAAYHGLYTVRDKSSAATLNSVLAATVSSHSYDILSLDLDNLDNVRKSAKAVNARIATGDIPPIRALILNAGSQDFGKQAWTDDGFDKTFTSNYLGHWLLTLLLLESIDKDSGRIVLIGSQAHDPYDKRNAQTKAFVDEKYKTIVQESTGFESIAKGTWSSAEEDPSYRSGFRRYGAAKLFLVMMMHELQRRIDRDPVLKNISILAVDPGSMSTALLVPNGGIRTTQKSASHVLEAAFNTTPESPKALYLNGTQPLETSAESRDLKKRDLVWKESVRYAHLAEGETILSDWQ